MRKLVMFGLLVLGLVALVPYVGCGLPHDSSIVYKKLTPEEFAALPPEDRELPEVMANMGDLWKDPNSPEGASNPRR